MANDNVRIALHNAGLQPDELAQIAEVDIRTVRRWLSGRAPYPRHRSKIARALDTTEHALWPELTSTTSVSSDVATGREPVDAYAHATDLGTTTTETLITTATGQIDLLDDTLHRLLTRPGVAVLLIAKASHGCRVRLLVAEPRPCLTPLLGQDGLEIRAVDPTEHRAIHRIDEQMLVHLTLTGENDQPPPLLHLRQDTAAGLFDRFAAHYDDAWDNASEPITTERDIDQYVFEDDEDNEDEDLDGSEPDGEDREPDRSATARAEPMRPSSSEPSAPSPRRWPRRPPTP